ncbi:MAG: HDIG domain-containing protein [Candidatus Gastranaerophilales bacterium]|nr:HDIG domain-containing protein [Candidatus Gastranaerophilales bacterium]
MIQIINNIIEKLRTHKLTDILIFICFSLIMTLIVSSQNFFFQRVIENGISKKDIIAQKTITVIDTKRTEQHRQDVIQNIEPILIPAEDEFIKVNLDTLQTSIQQIRTKNVADSVKKDELSLLFDIPVQSKKDYLANYLLISSDQNLQKIFDKAKITLVKVLNVGITESSYEDGKLDRIIQRNIPANTPRNQATVITALLKEIITPNLVVDDLATEIAKKNAQNSVKPYEVVFHKGDKIVFEGEPVTKLKKDALREAGYNVLELNFGGILGIFMLVLFATFMFLQYEKNFEKLYYDSHHMTITGFLALITALIAVALPTGFSPYILPFPAFIIILSIFTNARIAIFAAMLLLSILSIGLHYDIEFVSALILINAASMIAISKIKFSRRFDLILTGLKISLAGVIIITCIYMLEKFLIDIDNLLILRDVLLISINGVLSGIIALGTLPILESTFGIITPYGLAELADHNQPLLKRLQFEAPGTYHHSLMVSNLAEAAAEAIGANPILARVGAFYHDIGKLKRPLFFVENQSYFGIENPHTKLNPRLSKMVITAHPKDGVELAKEYHLPSIIHSFILQHHGEGLASYFYNQAIAEEGIENVKEEQFRYTGPKPNLKETAILMIADAVESAVRSLKTPSNDEIEAIIDKIIKERLNDGQFADCPLTLKDLKVIATTFNRILRGMQHNRIKYHQAIVNQLDDTKAQSSPMDSDFEAKIKQLEQNRNNNDNEQNT